MKVCNKCGNRVNDNYKYCTVCGNNVNNNVSNKPDPGDKYGFITLVFFIAVPLLLLSIMIAPELVFNIGRLPDVFYMACYSLIAVSILTSLIILVLGKSKYPENKFLKGLVWFVIIITIIVLLFMLFVVIVCNPCLDEFRRCDG